MDINANASRTEKKDIPSALTRYIKNMIHGLAGAMFNKLAPELNKLEVPRNRQDCLTTISEPTLSNYDPGCLNIPVRFAK